MGGGAADERPTATGVTPHLEPIVEHGRRDMASLPIPDELTVEIFLRLPTPADLVRASVACVSFRRIAADRAFLRLFRKLHAPPLLGLLKDLTFHPAVPPHPSAPAASAAALAADFSFSFLPAPARHWIVKDSRDGRVLLERPLQGDDFERKVAFKETVVCDPLHRRYLLLPRIPDDLAASVEETFLSKWQRLPDTFLVSPADSEDAVAAEETSFRVICMVQCQFKLFAFVFSSSTGQWRAVPSQSWSDLLSGLLMPIRSKPLFSRQYAYGCYYWMTCSKEKKMLVLDIRRMEFSIAELPPEAKDSNLLDMILVEAGDGKPGIFFLAPDRSDLIYTIRRYNGGNSCQWQIEKTIQLGYGYLFGGSVGRYLLLYQLGSSCSDQCYFTLDTKTFHLEKVCAGSIPDPHTYSNFPPSLLSSPTISSGSLEQGVEAARVEEPIDAGAGGRTSVSRTGDAVD